MVIAEMTNLPNICYETLALINLMDQNMANTSCPFHPDKDEYMVVTFKKSLSEDFRNVFLYEARRAGVMMHWYRCPGQSCGVEYMPDMTLGRLPSPPEKMIRHIREKWGDKDHPSIDLNNDAVTSAVEENLNQRKPQAIYFFKKCKFYDLSVVVRQFVFDDTQVQVRMQCNNICA